jgi:multiple sugar transport system permease protein
MALFYLIGPVLWTVISSISLDRELLAKPPHFIPKEPTLGFYKALLSKKLAQAMQLTQIAKRLPNSMLVSFIVSSWVTVLSLLFGTFAAYTFSRVDTKLHHTMLNSILLVRMIPPFVLLVPLYILMRQFHLLNTLWSLIISYIAFILPFTVWILKAYFDSIPTDMEDSAMVDGAGRLGVIFRIILPVSFPGLVSAALLAFIFAWEIFILPLVLISKPELEPVSVTLSAFNIAEEGLEMPYGIPAAAALIASSIPLAIVFAFQRYIVSGLTSGKAK